MNHYNNLLLASLTPFLNQQQCHPTGAMCLCLSSWSRWLQQSQWECFCASASIQMQQHLWRDCGFYKSLWIIFYDVSAHSVIAMTLSKWMLTEDFIGADLRCCLSWCWMIPLFVLNWQCQLTDAMENNYCWLTNCMLAAASAPCNKCKDFNTLIWIGMGSTVTRIKMLYMMSAAKCSFFFWIFFSGSEEKMKTNASIARKLDWVFHQLNILPLQNVCQNQKHRDSCMCSCEFTQMNQHNNLVNLPSDSFSHTAVFTSEPVIKTDAIVLLNAGQLGDCLFLQLMQLG